MFYSYAKFMFEDFEYKFGDSEHKFEDLEYKFEVYEHNFLTGKDTTIYGIKQDLS